MIKQHSKYPVSRQRSKYPVSLQRVWIMGTAIQGKGICSIHIKISLHKHHNTSESISSQPKNLLAKGCMKLAWLKQRVRSAPCPVHRLRRGSRAAESIFLQNQGTPLAHQQLTALWTCSEQFDHSNFFSSSGEIQVKVWVTVDILIQLSSLNLIDCEFQVLVKLWFSCYPPGRSVLPTVSPVQSVIQSLISIASCEIKT